MDDYNPIKSAPPAKVLEPGMYEAQLTNVEGITSKNKQTGKEEEKIKFTFEIPSEDTKVFTRQNAFNSEKCKLVAMLRSMAGREFTDELRRDITAMWSFIKSLKGRQYHLGIVNSDCGQYNNIQSVVPNRKANAPAAQTSPQDLTDPDDDIPF